LTPGSPDPIDLAVRALARRDLSARELAERLERRGVDEHTRRGVVERLAQAGYVDDARFAADRARALAERGLGDAAIRADLEARGVAAEALDDALAALEPEHGRARCEALRLGGGVAAARALVRKGFAEESLEGLFPSGGHLLG
jgi:regulatory protein